MDNVMQHNNNTANMMQNNNNMANPMQDNNNTVNVNNNTRTQTTNSQEHRWIRRHDATQQQQELTVM